MLESEAEKISQRKAAITAGISLLLIAFTAIFAFGVVQNKLIILSDAAATINTIRQSDDLFRTGIFCWLITLSGDVVIAWALYIFLKQVDNSLALLGAWFRLIYSVILGIAVLNLMYVVLLLSGDNNILPMQNEQLQTQVMLFVNAFKNMWSFGLIIFGFHLFIVGYLALKSTLIPKFLGILLLIASVSYIIIHLSHLFLPQYKNLTIIFENVLSVPMALGELGFGIWLLIKGGKIPNKND